MIKPNTGLTLLVALCGGQLLGSDAFAPSVTVQRRSILQTAPALRPKEPFAANAGQTSLFMVASLKKDDDVSLNSAVTGDSIPVTETKEEAAERAAAENKRNSILYSHTLALNSGILNGVFLSGILGKVAAVGPVTDSWTKCGLGLAQGDMVKAWFVARVLLSFGAGAFTAGLLNPRPEVFDVSPKTRAKPFLIASGMMAVATYLVASAASAGLKAAPDLAFFLVCATNGMQNSFTSFLTQNLCRTSHFTGTTTDLCTIIGQCLRGNTAFRYKLKTYGGLTLMFWAGGFLGTRWTTDLASASVFLAMSSAWYFISSMPFMTVGRRLKQKLQSMRMNP